MFKFQRHGKIYISEGLRKDGSFSPRRSFRTYLSIMKDPGFFFLSFSFPGAQDSLKEYFCSGDPKYRKAWS